MTERTIITRVTNAVLYSDGTIRLDNLRWSYPHVYEPFQGKPDPKTGIKPDPKFSLIGMLAKGTHVAAKDLLKARIDELMRENKIPDLAADKKFLRNGDTSGKADYKGFWTVSTSEVAKKPPSVRGPNGKKLPKEIGDSLIFGGVYGSLLLRPWYQNNNWGKRVNAGLVAVQYTKTGEPFGEGRISEDEIENSFDPVEGEDDWDTGDDEEL